MTDSLATTLKSLRESKGISQRDLSTRAGVDIGYICKLEAGIRVNPSLSVLRVLAIELDTPLAYILFLSEGNVGFSRRAHARIKKAFEDTQ